MLLAVDPGKMSGYACVNGTTGQYDLHTFQAGEYEHLEMLDRTWTRLAKREAGEEVEAVVCESFTITGATLTKSRQPWSLEQIGALRWMCHSVGIPFYLQQPSEAKNFVPDARLRKLGLWHRSDHARDATRHLILRLAVTHSIDLETLRLGA